MKGHIGFMKDIKPIDNKEKIVMSIDDNESMLRSLSKVKEFNLSEGHSDRYRAALILLLSTGCRPIEACKTNSSHLGYDKQLKRFSLSLPKEITKTGEDYYWHLPKRFNSVWLALMESASKLKKLSYDKLRKLFIERETELGISTEYTPKSVRKLVATKEFAKKLREAYLKEGGKVLQHKGGGGMAKQHYVGRTRMMIPEDLDVPERKRSSKR